MLILVKILGKAIQEGVLLMQVQIHYQGLDNTPWMDKFISNKVSKLNRYLTQSGTIQVNLKFENRNYVTVLAIHNMHRDYAFSANGENLYESFSSAVDKAARSLREEKRKIKDKISKKYIPLKEAFVA
jgi:ribosomal subunit interface protein